MRYFPYQIVELKEPGDLGPKYVELMSMPTPEGEVFARTVMGDPTSAQYFKVSQLGKAVPTAQCFICKTTVARVTTERVKRGDLVVTVCQSHHLKAT